MHRRRAPMAGPRHGRGGRPGGPSLTGTQQQYIRLVSEGTNNSAACGACGISRKTGVRWSNGRVVRTRSGHVRPAVEAVAARDPGCSVVDGIVPAA
jgi:hypothetical protein